MQGGVLSRVNPNWSLSSKGLVMRKCWGNGRENFGVQQLPLFNLLEPEELDWQVCLSWLEGKRRLDTRVPGNLHSHVGVSAMWCREWAYRCHLERWWIGRWAYRCHLEMWQNLVGNGLIDAIWKRWSHKRFLCENLCIWERQIFSWLVTGVWSSIFLWRYALARYRYRIYNRLLTDVPWLDTGVESGNSRQ